MSKTLVGIVTFGNVEFTKITVNSIKETTEGELDFFLVVGKPGDKETENWLIEEGIAHVVHDENYGFPYSLNDIYDYGFKEHDYDYIIFAGNDIATYPGTIDSLIHAADTTDLEWISATQYDVKTLCNEFPEVRKYFKGTDYNFTQFDERPWELLTRYGNTDAIEMDVIKDVHNLCLYKKSVFETIGYVDVNFFPAYYSDNDYARRGVNAKLKTGALTGAVYFHFWSRTIKQGSGGSSPIYFNKNRAFYIYKWGGHFAEEGYTVPFDGKDVILSENIVLQGSLNINTREFDKAVAAYWR